jgi:hypothetical protein
VRARFPALLQRSTRGGETIAENTAAVRCSLWTALNCGSVDDWTSRTLRSAARHVTVVPGGQTYTGAVTKISDTGRRDERRGHLRRDDPAGQCVGLKSACRPARHITRKRRACCACGGGHRHLCGQEL